MHRNEKLKIKRKKKIEKRKIHETIKLMNLNIQRWVEKNSYVRLQFAVNILPDQKFICIGCNGFNFCSVQFAVVEKVSAYFVQQY